MRIVPFGSRPRSPQHDGNSRQANHRPDPVVEIGRFSVHEPSPEDCQNNKDPAVGGIYAAKVREALQGGNDPIQNKDDPSQHADPERFGFPQPQPDQVPAPNFRQSCRQKQYNCLYHHFSPLRRNNRSMFQQVSYC